MPTQPDRSVGVVVASAGLALATAGALVVATFASEETVARLAICQTPAAGSIAPLAYVAAVVTLALLFWAAAVVTRRAASRRGPAPALIAVSALGVLFAGWIASLGVGFWAASGPSTGQAVLVGVLFAIAFTGPAVAALATSILLAAGRTRPLPIWLPPLIVLAVTAASAVVVVVGSIGSCG